MGGNQGFTHTFDGEGNLNINIARGTISGGNAAAGLTGTTVPTSADYIGFNSSGNLVGVSSSNPLPITGSISASNPSVGTLGSSAPTSGTFLAASDGTNLQGLLVESSSYLNLRVAIFEGANEVTVTGANALKVDASGTTVPVSGTFWQATQPVSNAGTFAVQASIDASQTIAVTQATASSLNATVSIASAQTLATVTTVGTVSSVTAIANALPAGTNTLGSVKVTDGTNTGTVKAASTAPATTDTAIVVGLNPLSQPVVIGYIQDSTGVQRAIMQTAFSESSSGATSIVSLSSGKKVYVLSWFVSCGGTACNVNLQSHTTTSLTSGVVNMAANGGAVFPHNPGAWLTTASGEALDVNLSASEQVNGSVTYCQF